MHCSDSEMHLDFSNNFITTSSEAILATFGKNTISCTLKITSKSATDNVYS